MALVDGDNILYHYFQKELLAEENAESRILIKRMVLDLSIWLPVEFYRKMPVILPFVIRDPSCRKAVNKKKEEWGSCTLEGYFRDDNTLIKAIPRKFKISGASKLYEKHALGKGFVASHIWRKLAGSSVLASRDPLTNSFVPNLVWLPRQISKLTDREGSFAQRCLQAISVSIYKKAALPIPMKDYVSGIWDKLPAPSAIKIDKKDLSKLNFFDIPEKDIDWRIKKLANQISLIKEPSKKSEVYCSRYLSSFMCLPETTRLDFLHRLVEYSDLIST